jgi:2-polyprenyl-3-methyl-5-hydroxy-6-metoxy-1,4-benzoquinol methylase
MQSLHRKINNYSLVICNICSTIQVKEKPTFQELIQRYNELYAYGEYERHRVEYEEILIKGKSYRLYQKWLLRKVEKICSGRKMIEIGGGIGAFGLISRNRGWTYINYDISEVALSFAKMLGLKTKLIVGEELSIEEKVDIVVMWEVIEHIWNVSNYLTAIKRALIPGGFLLLSTPNFLRHGYQRSDSWPTTSAPPIHLNFLHKNPCREC